MAMRGWDENKRDAVEERRREGLRRYWASQRSNARRKRQSEWAQSLNRTMPKEVRRANAKKISASMTEYFKDPKARAAHKEARYHTAANKRTRDLKKAREVLKPWGLTVEDNTNQAQLDEIFSIFL